MLTSRQKQLLEFIHQRINETGIAPSFDEMKDALDLASKSGIHRLVSSLEERGFLKRLPNRARALEVVRRPASALSEEVPQRDIAELIRTTGSESMGGDLPVMGRIAAGVPVSAVETEIGRIPPPAAHLDQSTHFALEVQGDSMINAGICEGDIVVFHQCDDAQSGDIVVALIDGEEATLKRLRKHKARIALEAANPSYETRIFGPGRVKIQGRLVALVREYS